MQNRDREGDLPAAWSARPKTAFPGVSGEAGTVVSVTDDPTAEALQAVVGAALVDDLARPTRLLAARRTEPPGLAGGWEFPGGKVEPGEGDLEALHRELCEELGIEVTVGERLVGPRPDGRWPLGERYAMDVWWAVVTSGEPAPLGDHDELRWLRRDELRSVPWLPADLPIVEVIAARMS
jgi:8-oxo-dGTP diphosphatase